MSKEFKTIEFKKSTVEVKAGVVSIAAMPIKAWGKERTAEIK